MDYLTTLDRLSISETTNVLEDAKVFRLEIDF
jgi:hypothetical protein